MKNLLAIILCFCFNFSFASTKSECLSGNFTSCKVKMNNYGRTSKKDDAVDFFSQSCSSENLKIKCEIISVDPSNSLKKVMALAKTSSALFTISGKKFNKIYIMSEIQ